MHVDLHCHSVFSDGGFTPEQIAARAARRGLGAVALTDHDTVAGWERFRAACEGAGVEPVIGVELTAEEDGHEVHLLGWCFDPSHPGLAEELRLCREARRQRIHEMTDRLGRLGIALEAETVFTLAGCEAPGRPHVAQALVREGHCRTLQEAFHRFLRKDSPAWAPKRRLPAARAIELVHAAGGVVAMAHPGLTRRDDLIPRLVELGLDGLECWHSAHNRTQAERYLALANECRLLITGGSDCHGPAKGQPLLGSLRVSASHLHALQERAREHRTFADSR
ncbi:MAG: PHP domain-containing protein [Verrucomicrobia bacterium]|nr:MAG: PHP domain-containing protein [Verrucomicrobiota bacterium]